MSQIVKSGRPILKEIKTVLSGDRDEAKRRVLNLYKLWYRQAPYVGVYYHLNFKINFRKIFHHTFLILSIRLRCTTHDQKSTQSNSR